MRNVLKNRPVGVWIDFSCFKLVIFLTGKTLLSERERERKKEREREKEGERGKGVKKE